MKKRVFMIHGYGGKPEEGWRPWLKKKLEEQGMEVCIPAMPDADHPRMDAWVKAIHQAVGAPDADCTFVGHSLGCITILRYLESLSFELRVGRVIFIAGFYEDLGPRYSELQSFINTPVDWASVLSHCSDFHVIHSDDDTSVPITFGKDLAEKLGVPLELHHGYKHFGLDDKITELPIVLEKII
jgi:predicted alpha/beta hydrolase family esterase